MYTVKIGCLYSAKIRSLNLRHYVERIGSKHRKRVTVQPPLPIREQNLNNCEKLQTITWNRGFFPHPLHDLIFTPTLTLSRLHVQEYPLAECQSVSEL